LDSQCSPLLNTLKHGFYSRRFSNSEYLDLESFSQDGLDGEIAMLRIVTCRVLDLLSGVEDLETAFKLLALLSQASVLWMPHPFSGCRIRSPDAASVRIAAMQRVKAHLAFNRPDELKTIFSEAIDEALHEMRYAESTP